MAQEAEQRSVEPVRAGLRDHVHQPAAGAAVFGLVAVGQHLELLHCLHRHAAAHAAGGLVVEIGAIHLQRVRTGPLAQHVEAGRVRYGVHAQRVALEPAVKQRKAEKVPLIDRQPGDLAGAGMRVHRNRQRIHLPGFGRHRDLLAPLLRPQHNAQRSFVAEQHLDGGLLRLEIRRLHADLVSARRQRRKVNGLGSGNGAPAPAALWQTGRHLRARHRRAGRVQDRDAQAAVDRGDLRRRCAAENRQQAGQSRQEPSRLRALHETPPPCPPDGARGGAARPRFSKNGFSLSS